MKQAPGGAGDPVPAVLLGAAQQPPCLCFARAHHPPPSAPFFGYAKKTYLKWEIPQEVASKFDDAKWRHS